MKKIITGLITVYLFIFFLIYCGIFRDNADPVKVTEYYFQCMRDYEWMLTYQITEPGCFNVGELLDVYNKRFSSRNIHGFDSKLLNIRDNFAQVQTKLIYKDQKIVKSVVTLKNNKGKWRIKSVEYV